MTERATRAYSRKRSEDWKSGEGEDHSAMAKEIRLRREGQKKEEDGWEKEIMKELREMRQEILKEMKREGEELRQEMREIKRQLERVKKRQDIGIHGKKGEGRGEAGKRSDQEIDEETDAEEKQSEEGKEGKEGASGGMAVDAGPKHEGEKREGGGRESEGGSKNWWEEVTSKEKERSEKSRGSSEGEEERTERWRGDKELERGEGETESEVEKGATRETDREEERNGRTTGMKKSNVRDMVKRREEKMEKERKRRERERRQEEDRAEREKIAKKRRSLIWSGLEGAEMAERKEFMEVLVEMALDRKVGIKGVVEIKGDGNKDLLLVEMEEEEDKKELFCKRWEMKKKWGVIVDEELTRGERLVRWRIEEKAKKERRLGNSVVTTSSRLWINAREIYWDEGRKEWRKV